MKFSFYWLLILSFIIFTPGAKAFSISPTKILLTVNSGDTKNVFVEVNNNEKQDMIFRGKVLGVKQDNQGRPLFLSNYTVAENWISYNGGRVLLKPGEREKLYFTIKVPESAPAGAYYLALATQAVSNSGKIGLTGQIVTLLNLQISGLANEAVKINKWELNKAGKSKKLNFFLNLENSGNIGVFLDGNLSVSSWWGQEIFREKLTLGNKLLAHSVRFLQPEIDLVKKNVSLPGFYQVKIDINYGKTNQTVTASTYVWYWSLWAKIGSIVLLLLILIFLISLKRKFRR